MASLAGRLYFPGECDTIFVLNFTQEVTEMAKDSKVREYGAELGEGIKHGMQGLNTNASPKKRKTAMLLIVVPLILFIILMAVGAKTGNDNMMYVGLVFGFCLGLHQFYVGKVKAGLLYTITVGGFVIGALINLFKLAIPKTFKDSNGFPLIY